MLLLLLALVGLAPAPPPAAATEATAVVRSVYDGDTFTLDNGDRVRLRGVNAPEMRPLEPFADDARQLAQDRLAGRAVTLRTTGRDSFGRTLADVSTGGRDLATALLEAGLAHVMLIPPLDSDDGPWAAALLAAEARARAARRGVWSTPAFAGPLLITSFHPDARGDDNQDPTGEYARLANVTGAPLPLAGLRVREEDGRTFPLPSLTVPAGHTVIVRAGRGSSNADPRRQITVSLGTDGPIFDNDGARIEVLDSSGRVLASRAGG
jgi:endonuclease YncB( thermonuclease family)